MKGSSFPISLIVLDCFLDVRHCDWVSLKAVIMSISLLARGRLSAEMKHLIKQPKEVFTCFTVPEDVVHHGREGMDHCCVGQRELLCYFFIFYLNPWNLQARFVQKTYLKYILIRSAGTVQWCGLYSNQYIILPNSNMLLFTWEINKGSQYNTRKYNFLKS